MPTPIPAQPYSDGSRALGRWDHLSINREEAGTSRSCILHIATMTSELDIEKINLGRYENLPSINNTGL